MRLLYALPLMFLPALLLMPTHALGQSNLYSNISVQMVVCNSKVTPDQCTKTWVGPEGTQFQSNAFTMIILAPTEVGGSGSTYLFQHWEDGSTNATRFVWSFQPNMTFRATYGPVQDTTTLGSIALGSAVAIAATVFTAYTIKSVKARRKRGKHKD